MHAARRRERAPGGLVAPHLGELAEVRVDGAEGADPLRALRVRGGERVPRFGRVPPQVPVERAGRRRVMQEAAGKSVLNLFAYTCGVGIAAAKAGAAHVVNVDFAESSLKVGKENARLNDLPIRLRCRQSRKKRNQTDQLQQRCLQHRSGRFCVEVAAQQLNRI